MPLGDGKGPPEGTGPMTGRRRFSDTCRALLEKHSSSSSSTSGITLLIVGAVLLTALIVRKAIDRN
jgi:hypothetical protein